MKKEKNIVRYALDNLPKVTEKDIKMLKSSKRKPINFDDVPEITTDLFKKAVSMPSVADPAWARKMDELTKTPTISLSDEVFAWFKAHSKNYEASIDHVLRHYILSHELPR